MQNSFDYSNYYFQNLEDILLKTSVKYQIELYEVIYHNNMVLHLN